MANQSQNPECTKCGGKTQKAGSKVYGRFQAVHQMYKCTACGHIFRGEHILKLTKPTKETV